MTYAAAVKLHPRVRKTIKRGGVALTTLLAMLWIGSGKVYVEWTRSNGNDVYLENGMIGFRFAGDPWWANGPIGLKAGSGPFEIEWKQKYSSRIGQPSYLYLRFGLWLV